MGVGVGLPLSAFRSDAAGLTAEEFRAQHGACFLVTQNATTPIRASKQTVLSEPVSEDASAFSFLVFPLLPRPANPFPGFLSIGRTANNDIVLDDASISKCHAFIRMSGDGVVLEDANSKNGTSVGGKPCGAVGNGQLLSPGDRVLLGSINLTFVTDKELVVLCMQLPE
ncbi:MAG: FHA domain-containing protein [Myxococcota bacterium]